MRESSWAESYPNAYIELMKSEVRDLRDKVEFEFRFVRPVKYTTIELMKANPQTAVGKTIADTLRKKKWTGFDGPLVPFWDTKSQNEKGDVWTLRYVDQRSLQQ